MNKKKKKLLWRALLALDLCVLLVSAFLLIRRAVNYADVKKEENSATIVLNLTDGGTALTEEEKSETPDAAEKTIKPEFRELLNQNGDFVGILSFADMNLYVCKGTDNSFYLNHKFDRTENAAGMIFMDCACEIDPECENLVLFGHNMKDGSRFGKLKRYERKEYLRENPVITFETLYEKHCYTPFAVLRAGLEKEDESYFMFDVPGFFDGESFDAYVNRALELSLYDTGVIPSYGDGVLTLATCTTSKEKRLVILCTEINQVN